NPLIRSSVISKELNPVLTRSNTWTHGKAKSTRKMASTPIIVEDVAQVEALENVHDHKEQYSNSKNWSSDDFLNLVCAWSQVSQNLATTNNQKAATFWFKVRDQFNSFYVDQSMWRSYNSVNCAYKGRLNKEWSIFRGIIQDLESRHQTSIGTDDFVSISFIFLISLLFKGESYSKRFSNLISRKVWQTIHFIKPKANHLNLGMRTKF
ncbi:hypothetical protein GIB67_042692, partial [Kingdonia uniflora]